jgi:hypothetical protein
VADLAVKRQDLVVATHGRSFWILDDLTPLHQLTPEIARTSRHLFRPRDTHRFLSGGGGFGGRGAAGENPPYGAIVHYLLPEDLTADGAAEVKLEVLDAQGNVLRTLSSRKEEPAAPNPYARFFPEMVRPRKLPAKKGMNRWVWDLRLPDAFVVEDAVLWGRPSGPQVAPGTYRVRMTLGDFSATESFRVLADPRQAATPEQLAEQHRLAREAWQGVSRAHRAVERIRDVRSQAQALADRLKQAGNAEGIEPALASLDAKLTAIEADLHQGKSKASQDILNFPPALDNQLLYVQGMIESAPGAPTRSSVERLAELTRELDGHVAALDAAVAAEVAAFNRVVRERQAPAVVVPPAKP